MQGGEYSHVLLLQKLDEKRHSKDFWISASKSDNFHHITALTNHEKIQYKPSVGIYYHLGLLCGCCKRLIIFVHLAVFAFSASA